MTYRLNEYHTLKVNKIDDDCYEVELVEFVGNREIRLSKELYSKDALEFDYDIVLN